METRKLGRQGLTASALGLGCMGMSEFCAGRGFLTGQFKRFEDLPPEDDYRRQGPFQTDARKEAR
ncbi:hypothetical protein HJC10_25450 [Corallococcus exiguus]|uniref:hypothetical protein n=1 Tax=Corallococcus TaxID=83461 RepID=UPI000EE1246F|nr:MULTISPECIES: hypothetical protein [Corallococcus]NNB85832.1 hypothetical protein [Corallococcus exiguus]NNC06184.1 hypothetical protein [Corallococcus exiguus]NPC50074.1 hypothetical protein [Corallococcus exiguus]RKH78135.1 hypothetical protein D7X99_29185 [Corallococcus sp. AB032C]